jgi:WD40 repeat protein
MPDCKQRFSLPKDDSGAVSRVAFSPDGKTLFVCRATGVFLHDAGTGKQMTTLKIPAVDSAISGDAKLLATFSGPNGDLWELPSGKRRGGFTDKPFVQSFEMSPDGKVLAIAMNSIRLQSIPDLLAGKKGK